MNTSRRVEEVPAQKEKVSIHPPEEDSIYKVKAGKESWIDVVIENKHYNPLPSALEAQLFIASHWYRNDTLVEWDGLRTPLELDVIGKHRQKIRIMAPENKGIYEIQPDMVKEGAFWLMLQPKYIVQVY